MLQGRTRPWASWGWGFRGDGWTLGDGRTQARGGQRPSKSHRNFDDSPLGSTGGVWGIEVGAEPRWLPGRGLGRGRGPRHAAHLVELVGFGERLADVQVRIPGGLPQGVVDIAGHRLCPD